MEKYLIENGFRSNYSIQDLKIDMGILNKNKSENSMFGNLGSKPKSFNSNERKKIWKDNNR